MSRPPPARPPVCRAPLPAGRARRLPGGAREATRHGGLPRVASSDSPIMKSDGVVAEVGSVPPFAEPCLPERHRLRKAERGVGHDGLQVQLADRVGVVAGPRQQPGQRCETIVHRAPVGGHAVTARIQPRDHRAAARRADLVWRQVVVEADAARRHRVDVRRPRKGGCRSSRGCRRAADRCRRRRSWGNCSCRRLDGGARLARRQHTHGCHTGAPIRRGGRARRFRIYVILP